MLNLEIRQKCLDLEFAIQSVLNTDYNEAHIAIFEELSNDSFDSGHFLFRSHSWVPLSYAVHSIEQVIGEIRRREVDYYKSVMDNALAVLQGKHLLLRTHSVVRLHSMNFLAERNEQARMLVSIADTLRNSYKCKVEVKCAVDEITNLLREIYPDSIIRYLLTQLLVCMFKRELSDKATCAEDDLVHDRDKLIAYPSDDFWGCWNADNVDWQRMNKILSAVLCEEPTVYNYTCFGWGCVECRMPTL